MPLNKKIVGSTKLLLSLLIIGGGTAARSAPENLRIPSIVTMRDGPVRGFVDNGVWRFLGIPYAAPPIGDLRWRPPTPQPVWQGVRDATKFGASCPQVVTFGTFAGPASVDEDCLFLNVFTTGSWSRGPLRPVIIWIHGGGNVDGASNDYDGSALARGGPGGVPSVVVTFNYRLGVFGFFSHPAIDDESHLAGNYGILDQQAVLHWVRRNIAAFGGDPDRVTIAGQSAGAIDVGVQLMSPLAKGLFQRAILMSSPAFTDTLPQAKAVQTQSRLFAEAAGCPGINAETAQCLRALSPERVLQLAGSPAAPSPLATSSPFVDGTVVPTTPTSAWKRGVFNRVPLLVGSTRDEAGFFLAAAQYYAPNQQALSSAQVAETIKAGSFCLGCSGFRMPANIAVAYPFAERGSDPITLYRTLNSDGVKCRERRVVRAWSRFVRVYAYDFAYETAPFYFPALQGFRPGATHTIDLQFLFDGFKGGILGVNLDQLSRQPRRLNSDEQRLSGNIIGAWTRFAANGDPVRFGSVSWLAFDVSQMYMAQDLYPSTVSADKMGADHQCRYWDSFDDLSS